MPGPYVAPAHASPLRFTAAGMRDAAIWLMLASAFVVIIEPAPVDLFFVGALIILVATGLRFSVAAVPLAVFLLIYNLAGMVSFLQVYEDPRAAMFVITSTYMAVSAVVMGGYIADDPLKAIQVVERGWMVAAVIASVIALGGYLASGSLHEILSPIGRAQGLFKDPNVFSTFIIPPTILSIRGFLQGTHRRKILALINLMILLAAQFLAFSRGAWMNVVLAAILLVGLTFMLSPDPKMRTRIMVLAIGGFVLSALLLAIMLSNPRISALFSERANVMNYYDVGETGRFGNQLRSIPMLLVRPNGFGPVQFRHYLGHDPHNVFLNAFASFGWLGGIAYLTMVVSTLVIGVKSILRRSPWQSYAIAIFSCFVAVALQGVQIDTEHWRHFYWLLGAMWGLFAATYTLTPQVPRDADADDQPA